jgi:hypothetical protein
MKAMPCLLAVIFFSCSQNHATQPLQAGGVDGVNNQLTEIMAAKELKKISHNDLRIVISPNTRIKILIPSKFKFLNAGYFYLISPNNVDVECLSEFRFADSGILIKKDAVDFLGPDSNLKNIEKIEYKYMFNFFPDNEKGVAKGSFSIWLYLKIFHQEGTTGRRAEISSGEYILSERQ